MRDNKVLSLDRAYSLPHKKTVKKDHKEVSVRQGPPDAAGLKCLRQLWKIILIFCLWERRPCKNEY